MGDCIQNRFGDKGGWTKGVAGGLGAASRALSSQVIWTADRTGDVYLVVFGFDEESTGTYRLEVYSTSARLKEETLEALSLPVSKSSEIVGALDDEFYTDEYDEDDPAWDDSQSLVDSDLWDEEDEAWSDI